MGFLADLTALVLEKIGSWLAKLIARDVKDLESKVIAKEDEKRLEEAKSDEDVKNALKSAIDHTLPPKP